METSLHKPTIQSTAEITALKGVGPKLAEKLLRVNVRSQVDALFHLPSRYQDKTRLTPIGGLRAGDEAAVQGEVVSSQIRFGRKRSLLVNIADGTGTLTLRFFHFSKSQEAAFQPEKIIRCFGEIRKGPFSLEIVHPEYRQFDASTTPAMEEELTPVYPTTEGVQQRSWRMITNQCLQLLSTHKLLLDDLLPYETRAQFSFPVLSKCLTLLHRPTPDVSVQQINTGKHPAQQRLIFEELLAHHIGFRRLRKKARQHNAIACDTHNKQVSQFLKTLPFALTQAQLNVISAIKKDLSAAIPMQRLVQGDVGSGKTIVAAVAAFMAVNNDYQTAIMAPTELLAEQHYQNFLHWCEPLNISVTLLSGALKGKARKSALAEIASQDSRIVIGTHALFQQTVEFNKVALVIIDEQHRFGVHQRLALREKGRDGIVPHQLVMTATPIPRTLAMTLYADLDVSVIDELPAGRKPIDTVVIPQSRRDEIMERVNAACTQGRQAYWVCPLIEESDLLNCEAAEDTAEMLTELLTELKVGLVHGRMKTEQKDSIMKSFKAGEIDLLVATTVIEVGVDVTNASLMIIENAERLGLSQLHQLRGRVGRGTQKSSCVLMYHGQLSKNGRARLKIMRETNDGFKISQKDLEIRGPGELLGTRQTGLMQFKLADLERDQALIPDVMQTADMMLDKYPEKIAPLISRWLPQGFQYGDV